MGCYSQIKPNEIDADIVIGNKDKSKIVELINEYLETKKQIKRVYDIRKICFEPMIIDKFENHTRAFVKIQEGCNAFCSYCIIPYTRGGLRSKDEDEVVKEVTNLVNNGYKEIVLTGIHTGRYGIEKNTSLEHLLTRLINIPNIFRIRLSSIEINEITDEILSLIKNNDVIANHLHIPLQSGSDKILKLMNRHYNVEYFLNRIEEIRKIIPNISITTDLIVGFPNETDEDFNDTINTLKKIKFTKIHTFPYSKREGTPASKMDNQVDGNIKKQRVHIVLELSDKFELEFYKKNINKEYEVVTELKKNNISIGYTSNYIPIIINEKLDNEIVTVKIEKVLDDKSVYGKIK